MLKFLYTRRTTLCTILFAAFPFLFSSEDATYGLKMITKAGRGVCWIEKLHKLPPINEQGVNWGTCDVNMDFRKNEYENMLKSNEDNIKSQGFDPKKFRDIINKNVMRNLKLFVRNKLKQLPPAYGKCNSYVDNENIVPDKNYSTLLKDSSGGSYPWKGFAYCLVETMETRNGADSISALKSYWTSPKPFRQAIIDRENENRAHHGVPPLKLDPELNKRAQRYAKKLAKICKMEHISDDHPDAHYKDGPTGENLAESGAITVSEADSGLEAANGWYSEIEYYPWPLYNGNNAKGVIGHFTTSVWKSTKLAGYGVAKSPGCDKVFVVARYYTAGNMIYNGSYDKYKENVLPPIK